MKFYKYIYMKDHTGNVIDKGILLEDDDSLYLVRRLHNAFNFIVEGSKATSDRFFEEKLTEYPPNKCMTRTLHREKYEDSALSIVPRISEFLIQWKETELSSTNRFIEVAKEL